MIQASGSHDFLAATDRRYQVAEPQPRPGMNREQRRKQAKASKRPPARRHGQVAADPVRTAILRATRLTRSEREAALQPARDGFKALREGVATYGEWCHVCTLVTIALAIEDQGVIRGMREHLQAAERAIDAVYRRVQQAEGGPTWGRRTTLYFQEIEALREAIALHDAQLQVLSAGELHAAVHAAERNVLAGGGRVIRDDSTPQPVQEVLL